MIRVRARDKSGLEVRLQFLEASYIGLHFFQGYQVVVFCKRSRSYDRPSLNRWLIGLRVSLLFFPNTARRGHDPFENRAVRGIDGTLV